MNPILSTWNWLNGKKTFIGAGMLILATAATGGLPLIPAIPLLAPAVPYLFGIGTLLGGTGMAHKIVKGFPANR